MSLNEDGLVIDLFAGGGGASLGLEMTGLTVDVAVNHDPEAVAMHAANHPNTQHFCNDVFAVHPLWIAKNRPVNVLWASPDCKHFSKAKGSKPREKNIRDLAWVVVEWAKSVRPQIIFLENVEEFRSWGPLDENGQPDKALAGKTFKRWVRTLRAHGYRVDWRELRACDYGSPTTRKRLFLIARCDGLPIVWPEPTHGQKGSGLAPVRTAAECLDWTIPCPSIFERERPLAEKTLRRIARGIERFVINSPKPFIVNFTHGGRLEFINEPMKTTITGAHRGEKGLAAAFLSKYYGGVTGSPVDSPIGTVTAIDHHGLVAANLIRHFGRSVGQSVTEPAPTTTAGGSGKTGLVTSNIVKLRGTCQHGQPVDQPLATITAGGNHAAEFRAFLVKYYGTATGQDLARPLGTIVSRARFGLVTVSIGGEPYIITDIGLRMLAPHELFAAQGFPPDYNITAGPAGRKLSKTAQIRLCGNSVCPQIVEALVQANVGAQEQRKVHVK